MSSNLKFGTSVEIVYTTLKELFPEAKISIEKPVGEILPHEADRECFREGLEARLRDLRVELELPSIEPHLSLLHMGGDISDWSVMLNSPALNWVYLRDKPHPVDTPAHKPAEGESPRDRNITSWSALPGNPTTPYPGTRPPRPGPKRTQVK